VVITMGGCSICERDGDRVETRTYDYSEDGVVIFSVDMCGSCGDEILPVFFDLVGYGAETEVEWPATAERDYAEPESSSAMTD
jgi:hypothetical protein